MGHSECIDSDVEERVVVEFNIDLWYEIVALLRDCSTHPGGFYASNSRAKSLREEFQLCLKEAAEGNERALKYIAKYMELRMKG